MINRLSRLFIAAAIVLVAATTATAKPCEDLKGMPLTGGSVTAAERNDSGALPANAARGGGGVVVTSPLPKFCRVTAVLSSGPGSQINVELWLPDPAEWNGTFLGTGNGGFAGSIRTDFLTTGLHLHYATANTDMGTAEAHGQYTGGTGKPEMIKDWGWRSTHAMTVAGKEITEAYYGQRIRTSLFDGCSTGGHQGLMEAQRFPDDYDGILAGAAGNNRIALHMAFLYYLRVAQDHPGFWISPAQGTAIRAAVVKRCAGQGSGLPTDDFVANPGTCDFDPATLLCKTAQDATTCLTPAQLTMLQKGYAGVQNLRNGHTIYEGIPFGAETMLTARLGQEGAGASRGTADLFNWVKGPAYDPTTFDFDRDVADLYRTWGADINALSADLSAFEKRGGKLITFHGWQDTTVSPFDSINYLDRLSNATRFARLFMVPGMGHCQGGPGIDFIGATYGEGEIDDPAHNILLALDRWVTSGVAPEQVIATKFSGGRGAGAGGRGGAAPAAPPAPRTVVATRPICAYPKVARYDNRGDATRAESFACVAAPKAKFTPPAPEYLSNTGGFGTP